VKPNWRTVRFNGTFLHENIYRQDAGPAVDAAWDALGINCKNLAAVAGSMSDEPVKTRAW
jgi:hypothetical protein